MGHFTKQMIADGRAVKTRTVDNWRSRGLLPPPIKLGSSKQSRCRWTAEAVAELDRNLAKLGRAPEAGTAAEESTAKAAG
jgi:hypothetical protein